MDGIKAIETRYAGHHFRSRIESRWATFFDALRIPWEFEPEGYVTDAGPYLPDFFLPEQDCFVEIKGKSPTKRELAVASSLCASTRKRVFIFGGGKIVVPTCGRTPSEAVCFYPIIDTEHGSVEAGRDDGYMWCQCHFCEKYGIEYQGRSNRLPCKSAGCAKAGGNPDKGLNSISQSLLTAYAIAASAQFENWEGR